MRRRAVGIFVSICGIAIAVGGVLPWVGARGPRPASGISHTAITSLLHWTYLHTNSYPRSFAFVVVVAGALVFFGGVFGSRLLAGVFSLAALAAAGLWIALTANHYSSVDLPYSDLRTGALLTIGAGLLAVICSSFVRGAGGEAQPKAPTTRGGVTDLWNGRE